MGNGTEVRYSLKQSLNPHYGHLTMVCVVHMHDMPRRQRLVSSRFGRPFWSPLYGGLSSGKRLG